MKYLISFILALILYGCNTEKRSLEKTQLYLFKHPEFTADVCAEQFPEKKTDTVIIHTSDTITEVLMLDSIELRFDSVLGKMVDKKLPPTKVITKTIYIKKDSIIYRENTAEATQLKYAMIKCNENTAALIDKNDKLERDVAMWKKRAKDRWLWLALLIGGAAAYIVVKVAKKTKLV